MQQLQGPLSFLWSVGVAGPGYVWAIRLYARKFIV